MGRKIYSQIESEEEALQTFANEFGNKFMFGLMGWEDAKRDPAKMEALRRAFYNSDQGKSFKAGSEARANSPAPEAQPATAPGPDAAAAEAARGQAWRDQLQAFYAEMAKPLDMNDPTVKRIQADVQGRSAMAANQRGIQGGLSNLNTEKALADSALGMQAQRQQLGVQALGLGLSDTQGLERLRQQGSQFDQQFAEDKYRYDTGLSQQTFNGRSDLFRTGGSIIGGAIGAPFGLAGPGAAIGSGVGGLASGSWSPAPRPMNPYGSGGYRGGY